MLTVTPSMGSAKDETVLTVAGGNCAGGALYWLSEDGVEMEGGQSANSDSLGNWTGTLNLDDTFSPARSYAVVADCYRAGGVVEFRYPPEPVEVRP